MISASLNKLLWPEAQARQETNAMDIHSSLTLDTVIDAVERTMFGDENLGFCISCGAEHFECEPDAMKYDCDECGEPEVYGAEMLLLMTAA